MDAIANKPNRFEIAPPAHIPGRHPARMSSVDIQDVITIVQGTTGAWLSKVREEPKAMVVDMRRPTGVMVGTTLKWKSR